MPKEKKNNQKEDNGEVEKTDFGLIKSSKIEDEMQESYLDYAMSVIVARALPDVRDGLKPVHRRILYAMYQLGLTSKAKFRKSATVVGEVLGKYHPHGDVAVYDSLVRMAQDFAMRYPLIDGQGNFGSTEDPPAAMRYTEARMVPLSEELLSDIEKETVNFMDNYDGTTKEPVVLPAKVPNLLLNGTMGIAVGMATNIPPHNLSETSDALIHLIDYKEATIEDLLKFIKGPDFPTGGIIYNQKDIKEAYATGRGRIVIRGKAEIDETKQDRRQIIISEIPYGVNKADLVSKIAALVKIKKIEGIADLRDESDREGIRIVLDLKRDAFAQKLLNQLYKFTQLQDTFHLNMLALIDGLKPTVLTLKMVLENWLAHRREVVYRRCQFEFKKAKDRAHILEGLKKAILRIDEVIKVIKQSKDRDTAAKNLIEKFKLDKIQAQAILEMRLSSLAALERKKIEEELEEKLKTIVLLQDILKNPAKILKIIKDELLEIKKKYGDERKTKIVKGEAGSLTEKDLIPNEEMIVALTRGNYIKRTPVSVYRSQARGGKGVIGMETKEEDVVSHLLFAFNLDNILFFTNLGRVFRLKVYEIPEASRIAKGTAIINLIPLFLNEKVTSCVTMKENEKGFLFMATKKGVVKKTNLLDYQTVRKSGLITIRLDKGDELKWARLTKGDDEVILLTKKGFSIRFSEKGVKSQGRATRGVRGIRLKNNDEICGMDVADKDKEVLLVTENGLGKKTKVRLYRLQNRGGSGIITYRVNPKTGDLISGEIPRLDIKDVILVSEHGHIIRIPFRRIPVLGRRTQGVRLMRLNKNDKVASVTCVIKEIEEAPLRRGFLGRAKKRVKVKPKKAKKPKIKVHAYKKDIIKEVKPIEKAKVPSKSDQPQAEKIPEIKVHSYQKKPTFIKKPISEKPKITKPTKAKKPQVKKSEKIEELFPEEKKTEIKKAEPNYWGKDRTLWRGKG